ncbi:hypothetical protein ACIOTN_17330 [Glutamicibacter sp. NPDC087661]|uniref:hypothetical protein n=1 Tax=Glutamicibacter sp. NPDC087661 TaxID=3363996 RepID=UPI0037F24FF2
MQKILDSLAESVGGNEVLYLFIGVGITLLLTSIGWIINSINDHGKWIRQEKYKIYIKLTRIQSGLTYAYSEITKNHHDSYHLSKKVERLGGELVELETSKAEGNRRIPKELIESRIKSISEDLQKNKDDFNSTNEKFQESSNDIERYNNELDDLMGSLAIVGSMRMMNYLHHATRIRFPKIDIIDSEKFTAEIKKNRKEQSTLWAYIALAAKVELRTIPLIDRLAVRMRLTYYDAKLWVTERKRSRKSVKSKHA